MKTPFQCDYCGGNDFSAVNEIKGWYRCRSCDRVKTHEDFLKSDDIRQQLSRAKANLKKRKFYQAKMDFEEVCRMDPSLPDGYFGKLLAHYGIEYVTDRVSKKIPIYHQRNPLPIRDSREYLALKNALSVNGEASKLLSQYDAMVEELETVRAEIEKRMENEPPYDIFICYRQSNTDGSPTPESNKGKDLYEDLTGEGYRVFFAEKTLSQDSLEEGYEPHVFHALHTARVMILPAESREHVLTPWVANEWTRYTELMSCDKSRVLIPVCLGQMKPEDFPPAMRNLQITSFSDHNFRENLIAKVSTVVKHRSNGPHDFRSATTDGLGEASPRILAPSQEGARGVELQAALELNVRLLSEGKFDPVCNKCEEILKENHHCSAVYWQYFLARNHYANAEAFGATFSPVAEESLPYFEKAVASANEGERRSYFDALIHRIERQKDVAMFDYYCSFEYSDQAQIDRLIPLLFEELLIRGETEDFDRIISKVKDREQFIFMKLRFADNLTMLGRANEAERYYEDILPLDPHNGELRYKAFYARVSAGSESVEDAFYAYMTDMSHREEADGQLFPFYNAYAIRHLKDLCISRAEKKTIKPNAALFEWILEKIPEEEHASYTLALEEYVARLMDAEVYGEAIRFIDYLLKNDPDHHEAYMNRLLARHRSNNMLTLLSIPKKQLVVDRDFDMAQTIYSRLHPNEENAYTAIVSTIEHLAMGRWPEDEYCRSYITAKFPFPCRLISLQYKERLSKAKRILPGLILTAADAKKAETARRKAIRLRIIRRSVLVSLAVILLVAVGLGIATAALSNSEKQFTDEASGVTVLTEKETFTAWGKVFTGLHAMKIETGNEAYADAFAALKNYEGHYALYDCSLRSFGKDVELGTDVTVEITVPEELKGKNLQILSVGRQNSVTALSSELKNGKTVISFKTGHFSLYAIAEVPYEVRFESFNGILHEKQSVFRKEMASTPTTVPVRGGYTFAGWCDQAGVPFEASTVPITSNRTIYAKWTPNTYTLRYDAGEGTLEVTEQKLTYGTPFTMPVPSLAGRRFVGWSRTQGATEAEFLPSVYQQGIVTANGAILTLYAVYE